MKENMTAAAPKRESLAARLGLIKGELPVSFAAQLAQVEVRIADVTNLRENSGDKFAEALDRRSVAVARLEAMELKEFMGEALAGEKEQARAAVRDIDHEISMLRLAPRAATVRLKALEASRAKLATEARREAFEKAIGPYTERLASLEGLLRQAARVNVEVAALRPDAEPFTKAPGPWWELNEQQGRLCAWLKDVADFRAFEAARLHVEP